MLLAVRVAHEELVAVLAGGPRDHAAVEPAGLAEPRADLPPFLDGVRGRERREEQRRGLEELGEAHVAVLRHVGRLGDRADLLGGELEPSGAVEVELSPCMLPEELGTWTQAPSTWL